MAESSDSVVALVGAAERLRAVRQAHGRFLALWAMQSLLDAPAATERLDAALRQAGDGEPRELTDKYFQRFSIARPRLDDNDWEV